MKSSSVALSITLILALAALMVSAADIRLYSCVIRDTESGYPHIMLGYTSDGDYAATSGVVLGGNGLIGAAPLSIEAGDHPQVFGVELSTDDPVLWQVYSDDFAYELDVTADAPACTTPENGPGQPDGLFETITIWDVQGDAFTWEIQDQWGNWHDIGGVVTPLQCENDRCFTRLVLGEDGDTNASHYRVTRVE
jgi:hypothetical protein